MTSHLTPFEREQEFRKDLEGLFEAHRGEDGFCDGINEAYKIYCNRFHVDYAPFEKTPWDMGDDE